jgi:hypothetical protein
MDYRPPPYPKHLQRKLPPWINELAFRDRLNLMDRRRTHDIRNMLRRQSHKQKLALSGMITLIQSEIKH